MHVNVIRRLIITEKSDREPSHYCIEYSTNCSLIDGDKLEILFVTVVDNSRLKRGAFIVT